MSCVWSPSASGFSKNTSRPLRISEPVSMPSDASASRMFFPPSSTTQTQSSLRSRPARTYETAIDTSSSRWSYNVQTWSAGPSCSIAARTLSKRLSASMVSSQRAQQSATFVSRPSTSDDTPTISHHKEQSTSTQVQLVKAPSTATSEQPALALNASRRGCSASARSSTSDPLTTSTRGLRDVAEEIPVIQWPTPLCGCCSDRNCLDGAITDYCGHVAL